MIKTPTTWIRMALAATLGAAALVAAAPASAQDAQPPVPIPGDPSAAVMPAPMTASSGEYLLQRGDELSIKVFGRSELDETVTVRPDGRISVPLLDDVEVAGLTTSAADQTLTKGLTKFFKDPQVTVIVRRMVNMKVFVGGEVGSPGLVTLTGELSAIGAVYQAGGFRPTAHTENVMLLRRGANGAPVTTKLDFKRAGKEALTLLQPHDVIYVPLSKIAKADKFVDQYMRQLIPITLTAGFSYLLGGQVVRIP